MATIRRLLHPGEFQEAIALSDIMFRDVEQESMGVGFPGVFSQTLKQSFGAFEDGKLVSFMGLVPSIIRIGAAKLNAYSLGSVCTDREHRGKGYATAMLEAIMAHMKEADAPLLLVSGGRSLYTRLGCAQYGGYAQIKLNADSAAAVSALNVGFRCREMGPADWFALQAISEAQPVRFERSVWDMAQLIDAEALPRCIKHGQRVLVAESGGKPVAFAIVGIPNKPTIKQPPRVYEWGGPAEAVASLLADAVSRYGLEELNAFVPWHETGLQEALGSAASQPYRSYCTVMIVSPERLAEQLRPYLAERDAVLAETFGLRRTGSGASKGVVDSDADGASKSVDGIELSLGGRSAIVTAHALISLLFDRQPYPQPETLTGIDPALAADMAALFPIPLPGELGLNYV